MLFVLKGQSVYRLFEAVYFSKVRSVVTAVGSKKSRSYCSVRDSVSLIELRGKYTLKVIKVM